MERNMEMRKRKGISDPLIVNYIERDCREKYKERGEKEGKKHGSE